MTIPEEKPTYHAINVAANGGVKREAPSGSQTSDTKRARPTKVKAAVANSSDNEGGAPVPKKKAKPRKKKVPRAEGESPGPSPNNPFNKPMGLR